MYKYYKWGEVAMSINLFLLAVVALIPLLLMVQFAYAQSDNSTSGLSDSCVLLQQIIIGEHMKNIKDDRSLMIYNQECGPLTANMTGPQK